MPGPLAVLRGRPLANEIEIAGAITARYSKARERDLVKISCYKANIKNEGNYWLKDKERISSFSIRPAGKDLVARCII